MNAPLDELYLTWLYGQIGSVNAKNPHRTYWSLFKQLYTKEFVWIVPNDDNRVEDGKDLRYEFVETEGVEPTGEWMELGCSFLEMLIGLARRLSFEDERQPRVWFWELLDNLGIGKYTDASHFEPRGVDDVLNRVIWRTYSYNGHGGLFPLMHPRTDQRDVEIWYQLSAYLLEREEG